MDEYEEVKNAFSWSTKAESEMEYSEWQTEAVMERCRQCAYQSKAATDSLREAPAEAVAER